MSDDEFDTIPDEFANIQGIDWEALLSSNGPATGSNTSNGIYNSTTSRAASQSGQHSEFQDQIRDLPFPGFPEPESRSSAYFSDGDNMDLAFLAELDRVEQQILLGRSSSSSVAPSASAAHTLMVDGGAGCSLETLRTRLPNVEDTRTSRHVLRIGDVETNRGRGPSANVPLERSDSDHTTSQISSARTGKAKASEIQDIISAYEDDVSCPICCDLLVAAHVGNPCGHTFCGECGWQWHIEKKNKGCPCCRQTLDKSVPMIPNIAMDNIVEVHVKALAIGGATEWESKGRKYMEWISKKKSWRRGAQKREMKRWRHGSPKSTPIEIFDTPDDWLDPFQDSDVELIPRPIRRSRRRQQRPGTTIIESGTTIFEMW